MVPKAVPGPQAGDPESPPIASSRLARRLSPPGGKAHRPELSRRWLPAGTPAAAPGGRVPGPSFLPEWGLAPGSSDSPRRTPPSWLKTQEEEAFPERPARAQPPMPRKAEGARSAWRVPRRAEGPPSSWEGRLLGGSHALFTDKAVSLGVQTPHSPQRPVLEVNDRLYHVPRAAGQSPRPLNVLGQVGAGPWAASPSSGHSSCCTWGH